MTIWDNTTPYTIVHGGDHREWPDVYAFGSPVGPTHPRFAWFPVRLWYGRWVWLRTVQRTKIIKHWYLSGSDWGFWSYDLQEGNQK